MSIIANSARGIGSQWNTVGKVFEAQRALLPCLARPEDYHFPDCSFVTNLASMVELPAALIRFCSVGIKNPIPPVDQPGKIWTVRRGILNGSLA